MKKITFKGIIAAAALSLISITGSFAQTTVYKHATRLGAALSLGVPTKEGTGDFVIAPDIRLQRDLGKRTSLTLTTGYYAFIGRDNNNLGQQIESNLIPLKAGAKFFFGESYYVQPEVGIAFSTKKDYGNPFVYAPSVGFANNKWDVALRYENFKYGDKAFYPNVNTGMVALRLAYAFKRPAKK
jgi:hypothetical protein